ncbi:uncharacterized protein CDAR_52151 [Caerostris darwini]|uniref:Uncharacterized protein n=1 Tax=Caerostris darwini TaxID=1538125 RepID=A0AAV4NM52_9ARAC|nr:uncharacterized protein CDAR_52151 [Caerostris darwini]
MTHFQFHWVTWLQLRTASSARSVRLEWRPEKATVPLVDHEGHEHGTGGGLSSLAVRGQYLCHGATESRLLIEDKSVEEDDPLLHTLHNVLISKMSEARNTVLHGSPAGHILVMDPFKMEPLSLTVQEPKGFVNVSLRKMSVEGLGNFQLRDIVTNLDILRTSVLMRFPEIKVKATYKLKGFLNPPFSQSLSDEGLFEARIPNGMASWIGRIDLKDTEHSGDSILSLSQAAFRTYWEAASHAFSSFLKKNKDALESAGELLQAVSAAVIEKVQKMAEEGSGAGHRPRHGKVQADFLVRDVPSEAQPPHNQRHRSRFRAA